MLIQKVLFRRVSFTVALCSACLASGARVSGAETMFRYNASHEATLGGPGVELAGLAWRFATGGVVRSTPAVADGLAIFGSRDGFLYAVDVVTGKERWKVRLGGDVSSSPAIAGKLVIAMAADGVLHALDVADGCPVWALTTGPEISFGDDGRGFDTWVGSPTVAEGVVYVGSGDGKLYAVDLTTGKPKWSFATRHRVRSTPAVADGAVFFGSFDGHLYAVDAATGAQRWTFQTGDVVQSSPAVAGGLVYAGSRSMALFALDAQTGALKWRRPHSGSWILASPVIANGRVFIGGSDSHLLEALDATTGKLIWSMNTGARMLGSATAVGDVLVYGGEDFRVYTIDLESGLGLSIDCTESALYSSAVVAGDRLLIGSDDHHLYAFRLGPATARAEPVSDELVQAVRGSYRTPDGDVFTFAPHQGRLALHYCTYPPAAVTMKTDGTFACPMLWGISGRLVRSSGGAATALQMNQFGREVTAERIE